MHGHKETQKTGTELKEGYRARDYDLNSRYRHGVGKGKGCG